MIVRFLALSGTAIQAAVFASVVYACARMIIRVRQTPAFLAGDPLVEGELVGNIAGTIVFGGSLGLAGVGTSLLVAVLARYRARWFFWSSSVFAVVYLVIVPAGTILGLVFLIYLIVKRREFFPPGAPAARLRLQSEEHR